MNSTQPRRCPPAPPQIQVPMRQRGADIAALDCNIARIVIERDFLRLPECATCLRQIAGAEKSLRRVCETRHVGSAVSDSWPTLSLLPRAGGRILPPTPRSYGPRCAKATSRGAAYLRSPASNCSATDHGAATNHRGATISHCAATNYGGAAISDRPARRNATSTVYPAGANDCARFYSAQNNKTTD